MGLDLHASTHLLIYQYQRDFISAHHWVIFSMEVLKPSCSRLMLSPSVIYPAPSQVPGLIHCNHHAVYQNGLSESDNYAPILPADLNLTTLLWHPCGLQSTLFKVSALYQHLHLGDLCQGSVLFAWAHPGHLLWLGQRPPKINQIMWPAPHSLTVTRLYLSNFPAGSTMCMEAAGHSAFASVLQVSIEQQS